MAPTAPIKREAPDDHSIRNGKAIKQAKMHTDRTINKKECQNCFWPQPLNRFPRPSANCRIKHSNDICKRCRGGYFKTDVMDKGNGEFPCLQCGTQMDYENDFKALASKEVVEHYGVRHRRNNMAKNGERECLADFKDFNGKTITCHNFQSHDPLKDGRIFKCKQCGNEECTLCSVREHKNETCNAFQARLQLTHGAEEAATAKAFTEGYYVTFKGRKRNIGRMRCPFCGIMTERSSGSPKVRCRAPNHNEGPMTGGCGMEFCAFDGATYLGKGSVPDVGNEVHDVECRLRKDDGEDWRFAHRVRRMQGKGVKKEKGEGVKDEVKDEVKVMVKDEEVRDEVDI